MLNQSRPRIVKHAFFEARTGLHDLPRGSVRRRRGHDDGRLLVCLGHRLADSSTAVEMNGARPATRGPPKKSRRGREFPACEPCHGEKVAAVDSAAFPHAVASECATCHSPHSSDPVHLLKDDVNSLCSGCRGFGSTTGGQAPGPLQGHCRNRR